MPEIKSVSVVIPVFNEVENLPILNDQLVASADGLPSLSFEFIYVDDGSKDGSVEALRKLASDPRVKIVVFNRNTGQTAAMSCGIKSATGDVIIPMDADLQNDPADIPRFLEKINEGYSCISGWRKNRKDTLVLRKIPSWTANSIISWMTGVHLHDYGCSMKAYLREIIQGVELYGEMHRFIPAYAAWSGAKVTEIVVNHRPRVHGISKYGISRVFKVVLDLIVVKFLTKYFNKPMHFFGAAGFISLFLGVLSELIAIVYKIAGLKDFVQTPLPTIGAMFLIVGVQFILFGLVAEVLMRTYYESQGSTPFHIKEKINL
ncbi:MAG: glycosyltransferase family 2 protein [Patescibacteria group bacterium]|nr:glycosyltransferase family 2 protein [Patescibacteria group bacterium]